MVKIDYWEKREREWIEKNIHKDADVDKLLEAKFDELEVSLYKDIQGFYVNYAKSQNITMAEAKKKVASFDVKAFEKEAKKLVETKDFSKEANERLKLYNATMRINRQQALAAKVGLSAASVMNDTEGIIRDKLENDILNEHKHQAGLLGMTIPERIDLRGQALVDGSYQGAKWSERLWVNSDAMVSNVTNIINRSLIQGMNPNQLASKLRPYLNKSVANAKYTAQRLARTESARISTEYKQLLYKDQGYELGKWIAETTACKICMPKDGKTFKLDDIDVPIHPNCRCSFVPYFEYKHSKIGSDQDSEDFHSNKLNVDISNAKGVKNYFDKKQIDEMNSMLNKAPTDIQKLYKDVFAKVPIGESTRKVAYYSQREQVVHLKRGGTYDTFFHEYAHAIDFNNGMSSSGNYGLIMSLSDDVTSYLEPYRNDIAKIKGLKKADRELRLRKAVRKAIKQKYGDGSDFDFDAIKTVSDVFKGQTNGARYTVDFDWGHDKKYYDNRSRPKEFFAETTSAIVCSPKELETIKDMLPDSYKQYQQTLEDIKKWQKEH